MVGLSCLFASTVYADIYQWTDENGMRHFTNYAPRDGARIIMKTNELPFDEAADRARREAEQRYHLELARQEIAERQAALEQREAQARRRWAEAEQQAQEKLQEAEDLMTAVQEASDSHGSYGGYSYYGFTYPYYGGRYRCRKTGGAYPHRRPRIEPYNRRYYNNRLPVYRGKDMRDRYHSRKGHYRNYCRTYQPGHHQRLRSRNYSGVHRSGSYGHRRGGGGFSGVRAGFRRR